jgi:hypothetical protein
MKNKIVLCMLVILVTLTFSAVSDDLSAEESNIPPFFVPPPPFSEGIFPCSQCHADMEPNPERRELMFHEEISKGFDHAEEQRWCLDCHNPDDRDKLRLANGKLISFNESYDLCGQCHGTIYRDWKVGVHGKRTGYWNGKKTYRLCVHCHYPHWPKFQGLKPLPPPLKPDETKYENLADDEIPLNPLGDNQDYQIPVIKREMP